MRQLLLILSLLLYSFTLFAQKEKMSSFVRRAVTQHKQIGKRNTLGKDRTICALVRTDDEDVLYDNGCNLLRNFKSEDYAKKYIKKYIDITLILC